MTSSYTIVRNPTNEKYWERIYDQVTTVEKWFNTPCDYQVWREGFGEDFSFYVAIDNEKDEAIGSSCATNFRKEDGSEFLTVSGMLFVDPAHRGKGIGMALADKFTIGYPNRSLIAVPSMSGKYAKKYGYDKIPEDNMTDVEVKTATINLSPTLPPIEGITIRSANESDWPQILAFDHKMLKFIHRDKFIKLFCTQPNSHYKIAVDESNNVVGVCLLRCSYDMKVIYTGPFYAEKIEIAQHLFLNVLKAIPNFSHFDNIRLAFYETSSTIEMLKKFVKEENMNMVKKGSHYLQFTKEIIPVPKTMVYSVTENDCSYI
jgi:GNAT superfamily N-acetyltransferase